MIINRFRQSFRLLFLAGLAACCSSLYAKHHPLIFHFMKNTPCDEPLNLKIGDRLRFTALEVHSAEYQWQLKSAPVYMQTQRIYEPNTSSVPVIARGGARKFEFLATAQGTEYIHIEYAPVDSKGAVLEQWHCHINISSPST